MTARPRPQLPQRLPAGRAPLGFGSTPARCTVLAEGEWRRQGGGGLGLERGLARRHGTRGCAGCFSRTLRASLASPQLDPLGLPSSVSSPCSAHWPAYLFPAVSPTGLSSVQFSSVQSCPTLCEPADCSTPCLPVHHQLPEFTQTHVHRVGDAIQPFPRLSSPPPVSCPHSFPASGSFPRSQLFASGGQSIGVSASTSGLTVSK